MPRDRSSTLAISFPWPSASLGRQLPLYDTPAGPPAHCARESLPLRVAAFRLSNRPIGLDSQSADPGISHLTSLSVPRRRRTRPTTSAMKKATIGLSPRAATMIQDCVVPVGRLSIATLPRIQNKPWLTHREKFPYRSLLSPFQVIRRKAVRYTVVRIVGRRAQVKNEGSQESLGSCKEYRPIYGVGHFTNEAQLPDNCPEAK